MITITVNDRPIHLAALLEHGRTLVALRAVAQATGASVLFDSKLHRVVVLRNGNRVIVRARIIHNRAYVPLRFIAERLGARVTFDAGSKRVSIRTSIPVMYGVDAPAATFQTPPPVPSPLPQYGEATQYAQFNFYTTNGRAYFPGDWMHFVLIAPPGGTAWLRLCDTANQYELWNGGSGNRYVVDVPAPYGLNIPNCRVDVQYTSFSGITTWVPIPFYIGLYTLPAIAPHPRATAKAIPVPPDVRRAEPTPTPALRPTPAPTAMPTPAPPAPAPKPVRTREPRPRATP